MTKETNQPDGGATTEPTKKKSFSRMRAKRAKVSLFSQGEPVLWLTGGGLVIALAMIVGLLALILWQGIISLWPGPVEMVKLHDGTVHMGEVTRREKFVPSDDILDALDPAVAEKAREQLDAQAFARRRLVRTGNFDLTQVHFNWVDSFQIVEESEPEWALLLERTAWGRFYGFPKAFEVDGKEVANTHEAVWEKYQEFHDEVRERWHERRHLEIHAIGALSRKQERSRLSIRQAELDHGKDSPEVEEARQRHQEVVAACKTKNDEILKEIAKLDDENARYKLVLATADGAEKKIALDEIVRAFPPNQLSFAGKLGVYLSRWAEYLLDEPREANAEGGVFPAIFGTVVMTLLLSIAVVPFGVAAALYLREYAEAGALVSIVRISINNLAGVPSIVFGVFGLGFFCYIVGGRIIDPLFFEASLPNPTYGKGGVLWAALTLALLTVPVVIVATEEALAAVPNSMREGSFACGASKWQTIKRIILPRALPGVMTGMILAMARGAGEVAPLMLVGAVKMAPELPMDGVAPYIHPQRSFMHLGFHIFDLGFQSQNSEAAKPMVFATTLLLIVIVFLLNVLAILIRTRLRKKYVSAAF